MEEEKNTTTTAAPVPVLTGDAEGRSLPWHSGPTNFAAIPLDSTENDAALSITYSLTVKDLQAYSQYVLKQRNSFVRILPWVALLIIAEIVLSNLTNSSHRQSNGGGSAASLLQNLLISFFLPLMLFIGIFTLLLRGPWRFRQMRKTNPGAFSERTISIGPQFFAFGNADEEGRSRWRVIKTVVANDRSLFIIFPNNTGHVVPRAVFPRPDDADTFFAAAQQFWRDGQAR